MTSQVFWDSFWPGLMSSFLSSMMVAVILAAVMPWLLNSWIERASLRMFAIIDRSPTGDARYRFTVYNTGRYNFKADEIYFHVYVPASSGLDVHSAAPFASVEEELIAGVDWYHITGMIKTPCFQEQTTTFLAFVAGNSLAQSEMRYFLSTSRGMLPRSNKRLAVGHFILDRMGRVQILADRR